MAYCNSYETNGEERRLYKLEFIGQMVVYFSVALDAPARIERYCQPHEASQVERSIME